MAHNCLLDCHISITILYGTLYAISLFHNLMTKCKCLISS